MKLFYAQTSPFARKVLVLARELGLEGRIEKIEVNPWTDEALRQVNPISQAPTLALDDGEPLYDSPVICDYLNELGGGGLIPSGGAERRRALRLQALADGACAATVRRVREMVRPEDDRHADVLARQKAASEAALDVMEGLAGGFRDAFGVGEIAVAVTCGYLDLRMPQDNWRDGRPALAAWYRVIADRPSMVATAPPQAPPG